MDNVSYNKLEVQEYFRSDQISTDQKRTIFKYRTRMERFGENFRGGQTMVMCPVCMLHRDSQDLSLQCPEVKKEIGHNEGDIRELYGENIGRNIVNTVTKVLEIRKKMIDNPV